jgi:hypothetical protein
MKSMEMVSFQIDYISCCRVCVWQNEARMRGSDLLPRRSAGVRAATSLSCASSPVQPEFSAGGHPDENTQGLRRTLNVLRAL